MFFNVKRYVAPVALRVRGIGLKGGGVKQWTMVLLRISHLGNEI